MEEMLLAQLAEFNQADKSLEMFYHEYAKNAGMSDCAQMMLYHIYSSEKIYTQKDLCDVWSYSRQTVNSALKNMERQEIVQMELAAGNKKNKYVKLTQKGKALAERTVKPLLDMEIHAFACLTAEERGELLRIYKKYVAALEQGESAFEVINGTAGRNMI